MNRYPALAASPLSAIAPVEPVLNVTDIQGNIVAGFNKDYQTFLFLRLVQPRKPKPVRKWIRSVLAPQLASTDQVLAFNRLFRATRGPAGESAVKATWINAAFSSQCLRALLSPAEAGMFGDEAFQTGLAARSEFLGDPSKKGAPGNKHTWKVGGPSNPADIVVIVASDEEKWRKETVVRLLATLPAAGLEVVFRQDGATLPSPWRGHEHFGFKDGISQPALRGRASAGAVRFYRPPFHRSFRSAISVLRQARPDAGLARGVCVGAAAAAGTDHGHYSGSAGH